MNIGAEAGMPSRLSCRTCPISCTQIRTTIPTANQTGNSSAYAPMLTQHGQRRAQNLTLSKSSASPLNFASKSPTAASGARTTLDDAPQATFRLQGLILRLRPRPFEVAAEDGLSRLVA